MEAGEKFIERGRPTSHKHLVRSCSSNSFEGNDIIDEVDNEFVLNEGFEDKCFARSAELDAYLEGVSSKMNLFKNPEA